MFPIKAEEVDGPISAPELNEGEVRSCGGERMAPATPATWCECDGEEEGMEVATESSENVDRRARSSSALLLLLLRITTTDADAVGGRMWSA